jgi:Zn-dependent protease with chaperone function
MAIAGDFYDGGSSRRAAAAAEVAGDGTVTVLVDGRRVCVAPLAEVDVSDRVGRTPRQLRFPGGELFETGDNESIDAVLAGFASAPRARLLHALESRWKHVVAALALVGASGWWAIAYGIPLLAERVARALPVSVDRSLGESALGVLDRTLFEPTRLDEATQARLRGRFAAVAPAAGFAAGSDLLFRHSPAIGANAFALPAGTIVLTDELVEIAEGDDEIVAVLAHEIGHVVNRHSLRQALQSSAVALVALAVTSDAGAVSSLVAGLPALLVQTKFSRDFEREADDYARALLDEKGISPANLANLLGRIERSAGAADSRFDFLSTHPALEERAARLRGGARREEGAAAR